MGQPVKIVDLAERMIRLSGLEPGHDIEIVFTGMRPGERLNEILFASEEPTVEIGVAGIMAAKPNEPPMADVAQMDRGAGAGDRQGRSRHHQGRAEGCGAGIRCDAPAENFGDGGSVEGRARPFGPYHADLKDPPGKAQEERRIDRRRIEMLAARAQALEIAANGHAGAAREMPPIWKSTNTRGR